MNHPMHITEKKSNSGVFYTYPATVTNMKQNLF
jgi:hypothetical protein